MLDRTEDLLKIENLSKSFSISAPLGRHSTPYTGAAPRSDGKATVPVSNRATPVAPRPRLRAAASSTPGSNVVV